MLSQSHLVVRLIGACLIVGTVVGAIFYSSGQSVGPEVHIAYSDLAALLLPLFFGLCMQVGGITRVVFDKKRGELTVSTRDWVFGRRRRIKAPLRHIREVSIVTGLGDDGDEQELVVHLSDGQRVELMNHSTSRSLAKQHRAIEAFVRSVGSGYR